MYNNILVPHAGTTAGDNALDHAIHLAKASNAKITIFHVVEEAQYPPSFGMPSSERDKLFKSIREYNKEVQQKIRLQMQELAKKCEKNGIKTDARVEIGFASDEILRLVKDNNIDLVVMAKRRKLRGIKKLLTLGSVSRKIVESVNCPVLLIDVEKI